MSKTTVILNPIAGRGAGARLAPQIVDSLRAHGLDFDLVMTEAEGQATALARVAAEQGQDVVVAAGGDGTTNEVINGLIQGNGGPDGTALGVLPVGTGNDFAFGAGIPLNLEEACQVVARGTSRLVDIGRMLGR